MTEITDDAGQIMKRITDEAHASLLLTPMQNPVLRASQIADSGALGFCLILDGFLEAFASEYPPLSYPPLKLPEAPASSDMPLHYGAVPDDLGDGLCLIVLGFQLNPDGSMQNELVGRLETALESAKKYPNAYVLCTGGGTASAAPGITESDVMAQWLMKHGIAKERIIVENRSLTTSQNAIFSCQILREDYPEITQAAIISSDYHIPWGKVLFEAKFLLEDHPITVVSNAAFQTGKKISDSALLRYQLNGIREIAGIS